MSARRERLAAWHAIDCAVAAGFVLKVSDGDSFDVTPPADMPDEIGAPIVSALLKYRPAVVGFLKFLASEEAAGRHWRAGARGTAQ